MYIVHIKIYLSFSWEWLLRECFICRPENVNASSILETKVWNWRSLDKERLKFWSNEQIEDPTIMTGQNVFHGLTKREEFLLKNYLLEIPISSRRPIPIWSYQSSAPCPVQIVSPKTQLGFFLSDSGPIIAYTCQSLADCLTQNLVEINELTLTD